MLKRIDMKNYKLIKFDKNEAFISGPDDKVFYELKQVVDELNKKDKEIKKLQCAGESMEKWICNYINSNEKESPIISLTEWRKAKKIKS